MARNTNNARLFLELMDTLIEDDENFDSLCESESMCISHYYRPKHNYLAEEQENYV
jgi:hypothetical protein